jgi:exodeoxyribonuclease-3
MKIASRNVNGIRSVMHKDFFKRVKDNNADIICLQEVKAFEHQMLPEIRFHLADYHYVRHHGTRPGYAGTAIFYKKNGSITEK